VAGGGGVTGLGPATPPVSAAVANKGESRQTLMTIDKRKIEREFTSERYHPDG